MSGENTGSIGRARRKGKCRGRLRFEDLFEDFVKPENPGPGSYFTIQKAFEESKLRI